MSSRPALSLREHALRLIREAGDNGIMMHKLMIGVDNDVYRAHVQEAVDWLMDKGLVWQLELDDGVSYRYYATAV